MLSLSVSLCTLTMIFSSCHTQKQMESLQVDSTNIHHAFNSASMFDLCDTITICIYDTLDEPNKKAQIIRHKKQTTQVTTKANTSQKQIQKTHKTKTTDKNQIHWQSYDAIISWSLLLAFLLFIAILHKRLRL